MNLVTIIAVLTVSLLFTLVFVVGFKSRGPWGSGWTFFTIVCLWLAAVSLWIPPAGPIWFGAPWVDLLLTGLLVSFVLSATSADSRSSDWQKHNYPRHNSNGPVDTSHNKEKHDIISSHGAPPHAPHAHGITSMGSHAAEVSRQTLRTGGFFWMLLLCLCALIIIGAA